MSEFIGESDEHIETRKLKSQLERKTAEEDLKWVLSDPRGRRYLWKLLESFHIYQSSFAQDGSFMAYLEGERNAGLRILNELQSVAPESYILMLQERIKNDRHSE